MIPATRTPHPIANADTPATRSHTVTTPSPAASLDCEVNTASTPHQTTTTYAAMLLRSKSPRISTSTAAIVAPMTIRSTTVRHGERLTLVTSPNVSAAARNAPTFTLVSAATATKAQTPIDAAGPMCVFTASLQLVRARAPSTPSTHSSCGCPGSYVIRVRYMNAARVPNTVSN